MSIKPEPMQSVPPDTAQIAHAAFPRGNPYLTLGDQLGRLSTNEAFTHLFASCGRPAETPWRLALMTVMQCAEGLSDRQAAEAVRVRIDWKYVLGLELRDAGCDDSVPCDLRKRLIAQHAQAMLLETLLEACQPRGTLRREARPQLGRIPSASDRATRHR